MKVSANKDIAASSMNAVRAKPASKPAEAPRSEAFSASAALTRQLENTLKVRPDKVALAKKLIADPHYPGPKETKAIASRLAKPDGATDTLA